MGTDGTGESEDTFVEMEQTNLGGSINPSSDLPDPIPRASLLVLLGEGRGSSFVVSSDVLIGRIADAQVRFDSTGVSRRHATISIERGQFRIRDLGSRNGTRVNGEPIRDRVLSYGDRIHIGNAVVLLFTPFDDLSDQLAQTQRMEAIGRLAGGIAHDFNNLLGVVLANLSYVSGLPSTSTLSEDTVREALDDTNAAARRAVELTRQLLAFARRGEWRSTKLDVYDLVQEVVRFVQRTFDRAITVETQGAQGMFVNGDASQLHQVFMNLCINARDAMPKGGKLTIIVREATRLDRLPPTLRATEQPYLAVTIRDTGVGMEPNTRARVFEPFFTTKEIGSGTGLGLATVYGIVKRHSGDIVVDSAPGEGSAFTVYLPMAASTVEPILVGHRRTAPGFLSETAVTRGLVLVVDDEDAVRRGAIRLLEQASYVALGARNAEEAISLFQQHQHRIDVVLLDLMMPGSSGEMVFQSLTALDKGVRVLVCSGCSDEERAESLVQAGAIGFLAKPYDGVELERAIERAMA